jgi:hypothetical protein
MIARFRHAPSRIADHPLNAVDELSIVLPAAQP